MAGPGSPVTSRGRPFLGPGSPHPLGDFLEAPEGCTAVLKRMPWREMRLLGRVHPRWSASFFFFLQRGMRDLISPPGLEPAPLHWGREVLTPHPAKAREVLVGLFFSGNCFSKHSTWEAQGCCPFRWTAPLEAPRRSRLVPQPHPAAFAVLPGNEPEPGLSQHLLLYARRPGRLFRCVGASLLRFSSSCQCSISHHRLK